MGGAPSYHIFAAIQFYIEGKANFGRAGYEKHLIKTGALWTQQDNERFCESKNNTAPSENARSPLFLNLKHAMLRFLRPGVGGAQSVLYRRRVLITGANQGIGFELAKALVKLGADVHIVVRTKSKGDEAAKVIAEAVEYWRREPGKSAAGNTGATHLLDAVSEFSPFNCLKTLAPHIGRACSQSSTDPTAEEEIASLLPVTVHTCDMSNFEAVRHFAQHFQEQHEYLDALVHNAACLTQEFTPTAPNKSSSNQHELIMATTLGGTMLLTQLLLPLLEARAPVADAPLFADESRVVNVASGGMYTAGTPLGDLDSKFCCPKDLRVYLDNSQVEPVKKFDGRLVYARAKRGMQILNDWWARKVVTTRGHGSSMAPRPVAFHTMHPGWSITSGVINSMPDFYEQQQTTMRSAAQGADTLVFLVAAPTAQLRHVAQMKAVEDGNQAQTPATGWLWQQPSRLYPILKKGPVTSCKPFLSDTSLSVLGEASAYESGIPTGQLWFDRSPVRKHMRWSGTGTTTHQDEALFEEAKAYCGL